jgi:hypothetical protein
MKRFVEKCITVMLILAWIAVPAFAATEEKGSATKGKEITVTGTVTCTHCKLANPDKPCKPGCCERCIKAGDPPLLTDKEGNQYILLTSEKGVSLMNPERHKMLGGMVTVKGVLVKGKGVQAIYVDKMEKAAKK